LTMVYPYRCKADADCANRFILCANCAKKEIESIEFEQNPRLPLVATVSGTDVSFTFTDLPGQAEFFASYSHFISIPNALIVVVTSIESSLSVDNNGEFFVSTSKLESDCRLWCSLVNQMTAAGKRIGTAKSFLIITHIDLLQDIKKKWKMNTQAEFESWVNHMKDRLPIDYPHMNLSGQTIQCLNACQIAQVQSGLWERLLIPAAEELLAGQMTSRYLVGLRKQLQDAQSQLYDIHLPPYLSRSHATRWLTSPQFNHKREDAAERALTSLINIGEVIQFRDGTIVFNREWLSRVISVVLKSSEPPFNGIKMKNGIIKYSALEDYLLKQKLNGAPLFRNSIEVQQVLHILSQLDLIILSREMEANWAKINQITESTIAATATSTAAVSSAAPSLTSTFAASNTMFVIPTTAPTVAAGASTPLSASASTSLPAENASHHSSVISTSILTGSSSSHSSPTEMIMTDLSSFIFVPSRADEDFVSVLLPPPTTRHLYGRRLSFRHPPSRFPPGTISRLVCWLGGFDADPFPSDYSRWQIHLKLGHHTNAYLLLDENHQFLDVWMWDRSENGSEIAAVGEKLMIAAKFGIALQLGDQTPGQPSELGSRWLEGKKNDEINMSSAPRPTESGQVEQKSNPNSQNIHTLSSPAVAAANEFNHEGDSIGMKSNNELKELTALKQLLSESSLCPRCLMEMSANKTGSGITNPFRYQHFAVPLVSPSKADSAFWICVSIHQHEDALSSLDFPLSPSAATAAPSNSTSTSSLYSTSNLSPFDVSKWSFVDVRDWFVSGQPLHDHFFRQLGCPGQSVWTGENLVEQIFPQKLDGSAAAKKAMHQMLEDQGYGFPSLRHAFIDGLYRLKLHYSKFCQQHRDLKLNPQPLAPADNSIGPTVPPAAVSHVTYININSNNPINGTNPSYNAGNVYVTLPPNVASVLNE